MAADQVVEFATLKLKTGVASDDERLMKFLRSCLSEIKDAGGEQFRFLLSSPAEGSPRLVGMTGIWPTDELHAKFLERGAIGSLMLELGDLLTFTGAVYLSAPDLNPSQTETLSMKTKTALFHVLGTELQEFEKMAKEVVGTKSDVLGAWNVTDLASNAKSKELTGEGEVQYGATWGLVVRYENVGLIDEIKGRAAGKFESVDVVSWEVINA